MVFTNSSAADTARLGPTTQQVEIYPFKLLHSLVLNLHDYSGSDAVSDRCLGNKKETFAHVACLVYVFDYQALEESDLARWEQCVSALKEWSPESAVFVFVHKADQVGHMEHWFRLKVALYIVGCHYKGNCPTVL
jgi:Ras-related GTP-binding protein A/B